MNHSVKRRRQALYQTHHHYYLNISVEAANLSDWRIEKIDSVARIESNRNFFCPNWNAVTHTRLATLDLVDSAKNLKKFSGTLFRDIWGQS